MSKLMYMDTEYSGVDISTDTPTALVDAKFDSTVWRNDNASSSAKGSMYAIGKWK